MPRFRWRGFLLTVASLCLTHHQDRLQQSFQPRATTDSGKWFRVVHLSCSSSRDGCSYAIVSMVTAVSSTACRMFCSRCVFPHFPLCRLTDRLDSSSSICPRDTPSRRLCRSLFTYLLDSTQLTHASGIFCWKSLNI